MRKEKYIDDIEAIKEMMDRSSKFLSLSGLSGVLAGSFALLAAYLAERLVYEGQDIAGLSRPITYDAFYTLIVIGAATIVLSLLCGIWLTTGKARKQGQSLFDSQAKRMVTHLTVPLVTGGLVSLILLSYGWLLWIPAITLIFYGLALENASKYAHVSMRYLGWLEIALGLVALTWPTKGLLCWAVGFGFLHIIYGVIMYLNDRS